MPYYCAERVSRALNSHRKPVAGSRVLLLGVSYKADVGDVRESPALRLIELLDELGADLAYHDPHVPAVSHGRVELISSPLDDERGCRSRHRLRRHRPLGDRLRRDRRTCEAGARLQERGARRRRRGWNGCDGTGDGGHGRTGRLGQEPAPQLRRAARGRPALGLRRRRGPPRRLPGRVPRDAVHRRARRRARRPRGSTPSCSPPRCRRTTSWPGGRWRPAST